MPSSACKKTSDGRRLAAALAESGATIMQATPATWRLLIDTGWRGNDQLTVLCEGEALSRQLAYALLTRSAAVWNLYGPIETTIWSAVHRVNPGTRPVPLGRPVANTELHVLFLFRQLVALRDLHSFPTRRSSD